jgi:5-dehydro-2-deoxygluconokinase
VEAFVLGRLHADFYPLQAGLTLDRVETFQRFVGGFAGNVGIGLARLGVRTAVLSGVGDDGHGRFIVRTLAEEGVETSGIVTNPVLRTAITFCELHPPDDFPLMAYRLPTCPDWELRPDDLPLELIAQAALLYVGGTALARRPSRDAMFAALDAHRSMPGSDRQTILDLDWRPTYWAHPGAYPGQIRRAAAVADTVIGGDSEFAAAGLDPERLRLDGVRRIFVKHGPAGASLLLPDETIRIPGSPVTVVNGLGSGDAFAAAVGYGLLAGRSPRDLLRLGNLAGAFVAGRLACGQAMPTRAELEALAAT